ncbi:hypothetical protein ACYTVZ_00815 [Escherichia coli]
MTQKSLTHYVLRNGNRDHLDPPRITVRDTDQLLGTEIAAFLQCKQ